jgi:TPP-dependent pyruvate/acetoin dehydrogenase alpha subunit
MRMRGHAEHDDMKYVPPEQLASWTLRDPIARYERHLLEASATEAELSAVVSRLETELAQELAAAESSPPPDAGDGLTGVYGDREIRPPAPPLVLERQARRV